MKKEDKEYNFKCIKEIIKNYGIDCQKQARHQFSETEGFILSNRLLGFIDYLEKKE